MGALKVTLARRRVALAARCTRVPSRLLLVLSFVLGLAACDRATPPKGSLVFKRRGKTVETITLAKLADELGVRTVESADPYYEQVKRFRALPVPALLALAYGETVEQLKKQAFVLYALDGYAVPLEGERLLDESAFIALDDVDVPGFAPIGPRKVSPAPAYFVWAGTQHGNLETHPRPWQLATIEIVDAEALYPHTRPRGESADSAAVRGHHIFRERCIRCHAINREGGSVGPELNVPQSIVAYRPEAQIRAYIQNPLTFRYGAMPPNPDLTESDLDGLLAYFRVMSTQPHDPQAKQTK